MITCTGVELRCGRGALYPISGGRGEKGMNQISRVTKDNVLSEQDGRSRMKQMTFE